MVYYLKYRPQTIDDLDNEDVRKTLTAVLTSPNPPHAYLFTGPKGLGKTSSARIVAKVLNCERLASGTKSKKDDKEEQKPNAKRLTSNTIEPCNECDMCVSITKGTNMDVLEIDAASNRGIDEMRDLRDKIRLSPVSARKKVYIIDEVHMLTTEAFNALLKTLEEPPSHAVFILATTEPQKVPATIRSRCLQINFHKATEAELLRSFKRIILGEKLQIDDNALLEIVKLSDGGFRDGAKMLEEVVLLSDGKKITQDLIEQEFHSVSSEAQIDSLLTHVASGNLKESVLLLESIAQQGSDMRLFLQRLLESIHTLVLDVVSAKDASPRFSLFQLQVLVDELQKAYASMRFAVIPQLPIELAIITYLEMQTQEHQPEASPVLSKKLPEKGNSINEFRKQVGELHKQRAIHGEKEEEKKEKVVENSASLMSYKAEGDLSEEWLASFWQSFITKLKDYNHTISGVLRGCRLKSFDRKTLIIETAYTFHKDRLTEGKTLAALEDAAKVLAGNQVTVAIELKPGK